MSARELTAGQDAARPPSLDAFIGYLAEIAESDQPIAPQSHLIEDLDFDAIAFNRLGLLMYERYGIGGLSTASLGSEKLTVEDFFQHCILKVLGIQPEAEQMHRPVP
jgi:hypothetical protein